MVLAGRLGVLIGGIGLVAATAVADPIARATVPNVSAVTDIERGRAEGGLRDALFVEARAADEALSRLAAAAGAKAAPPVTRPVVSLGAREGFAPRLSVDRVEACGGAVAAPRWVGADVPLFVPGEWLRVRLGNDGTTGGDVTVLHVASSGAVGVLVPAPTATERSVHLPASTPAYEVGCFPVPEGEGLDALVAVATTGDLRLADGLEGAGWPALRALAIPLRRAAIARDLLGDGTGVVWQVDRDPSRFYVRDGRAGPSLVDRFARALDDGRAGATTLVVYGDGPAGRLDVTWLREDGVAGRTSEGPRRVDVEGWIDVALAERGHGASLFAPTARARSMTAGVRVVGAATPTVAVGSTDAAGAADLGAALFPGASRAVVEGGARVVVVGPASITRAPFEAVPRNTSAGRLGDSVDVRIEPAVGRVGTAARRWNGAPVQSLVVGSPAPPVAAGWDVPQLPGLDAEVVAVARALAVPPFVGAAATPTEVLRRAPASTVVWLGAACVPEPDPVLGGAAVALSGPTEGDAWLTAQAIRGKSLTGVELVVLSACQGAADRARDAALLDLATAFLDAGARRVLLSRHRDGLPAEARYYAELAGALGSAGADAAVDEATGATGVSVGLLRLGDP
jgi:hypothetical protein